RPKQAGQGTKHSFARMAKCSPVKQDSWSKNPGVKKKVPHWPGSGPFTGDIKRVLGRRGKVAVQSPVLDPEPDFAAQFLQLSPELLQIGMFLRSYLLWMELKFHTFVMVMSD